MNTAHFPSGVVREFAGAAAGRPASLQVYAVRSHFQRWPRTAAVSDFASSLISKAPNGSRSASTRELVAVPIAAASRAWSKAGTRVFFTGSTSQNADVPPTLPVRYQNFP